MLFWIILLSWYASGVFFFQYWWRHQFDFTTDELPLALICAIAGPGAYILGYFIHGRDDLDRDDVLLPKRKK